MERITIKNQNVRCECGNAVYDVYQHMHGRSMKYVLYCPACHSHSWETLIKDIPSLEKRRTFDWVIGGRGMDGVEKAGIELVVEEDEDPIFPIPKAAKQAEN